MCKLQIKIYFKSLLYNIKELKVVLKIPAVENTSRGKHKYFQLFPVLRHNFLSFVSNSDSVRSIVIEVNERKTEPA
jgi:hypothetical protein